MADATACCEAVSRATMRFVAVKSRESQAILMLHKTREQFVKQRTMNVNALRGHLAEFGIVAARGIGRVEDLLELAEKDASLPRRAQFAINLLALQITVLDASIVELDAKIKDHCEEDGMCRLLDGIPGVGPLIASAVVASLPEPAIFKSARDFAAWLGLTPRQNSTGGKETLGSLTKQGNRYVRKLLVTGATSLLAAVKKRKGALADWMKTLLARKPARLATAAIANKLARILFAMLKSGEAFRTANFAKV
jgi:transposase